MNILHLNPTDVLFFRDGRPMDGASSGHGAAWPMPHVINAAFHAALHRADISGVHEHRRGRSSDREDQTRDKKFGGLVTAGPFPVNDQGQWFFPRPADAQIKQSSVTSLHPRIGSADPSSLQPKYPVVNGNAPTKIKPEPWLSQDGWNDYLKGENNTDPKHFVEDWAISKAEHQIGIAIDPDTGTTVESKFYSASYLRLKPKWRMGVLAEAHDRVDSKPGEKRDLIHRLLDTEKHLIVGGQQRICTAEIQNGEDGVPLPFPTGPEKISGTQVKWTLLTPAVFPVIGEHRGGWLPSWIDEDSRRVHLLDGPGKNKAKRLRVKEGATIGADFVAAVIPRAIPITGWALSTGDDHGAKSTHLAVPAGAVYYFEADDETEARKLADALNWHGNTAGTEIINRRSTIFGEKGFGLGVCSTWQPYQSSSQVI